MYTMRYATICAGLHALAAFYLFGLLYEVVKKIFNLI